MAAPPPFTLPGYEWDGKRFFKAPPQSRPAAVAASTDEPGSSAKRNKSSSTRSRRAEPSRSSLTKTQATLHEQLRDLALREWEKPRSIQTEIECRALSSFVSTRIVYPDCLPNEEEIVKLAFDDLDPSVLRLGGSSGTIATGNLGGRDELAEWMGGGYYPNDEFGFRTNWFAPNKITSLETSNQRVLATCLGPPAQAIVSTTSNTISMASVTLSPRKTSLWTSAISSSLVALGCDKKVLISTNPEQAESKMEGIQTGSKSFGDGTVFSLDLYDNLVFAGLRKGCMRMFDRRARHSLQGQERATQSRNELELFVDSPVTNIKVLREDPNRVVLAAMNGSVGVYDLRFPTARYSAGAPAARTSRNGPSTSAKALSIPTMSLEGHSNSFSTDLGFDTFRDEFLVAAGQDQRIRLWSLRTGGRPISPRASDPSPTRRDRVDVLPSRVMQALESLPRDSRAFESTTSSSSWSSFVPNPSPWLRQFDSPIKSIKFSSHVDPLSSLDDDQDGSTVESRRRRRKRLEREEGDATRRGRGGGGGGEREQRVPKSLWVADGAGIECFGLV